MWAGAPVSVLPVRPGAAWPPGGGAAVSWRPGVVIAWRGAATAARSSPAICRGVWVKEGLVFGVHARGKDHVHGKLQLLLAAMRRQ